MTSKSSPPREAYVWIWLDGAVDPVVAGRLEADGANVVFNYGRSYLAREDAIPIYLPELPLRPGAIAPTPPLEIANAIRDAAPDAWGRRVIINRLTGLQGAAANEVELDEITFLLQSGSDRVGALDFQTSPTEFLAREAANATLEELQESASLVEKGLPLTPQLAEALQHGTAIGGARPKALINGGNKKYVAKFSSSTDTFNVVKGEYIAMRLAALAGINVAPVKLTSALDKDVLLVERFDRIKLEGGWGRRAMVSALTLFGLHEMMAAHASYQDLAETIRARFTSPKETLRELYARMCFNILVGNTDDHARNHAAFWDGERLSLTPAYDICPQSRVGREASHAMFIHDRERGSRLAACLDASRNFLIAEDAALDIIKEQIRCIKQNWDAVCEEASLGVTDQFYYWKRQFLNNFAFEGLENTISG